MAGLPQGALVEDRSPPVEERLRDYLQNLPETMRDRLRAAILAGEHFHGSDLIAAALSPMKPPTEERVDRLVKEHRAQPATRAFFTAIDPHLVDERINSKRRGHVSRASLVPIWTWIARDVAPDEAAVFQKRCDEAARDGSLAAMEPEARAFRARVMPKIEAAVARDRNENRGRVAAALGQERTIVDLADVIYLLTHADQIAAFDARLPHQFKNLATENLANAAAAVDAARATEPDIAPYVLARLQARLAHRWQIVRIATAYAHSDEISKLAASPYAEAVELALSELERTVVQLSLGAKEGRYDRCNVLVREFHDAVRGLRTEIEFSGDNAWTRLLAKHRADAARVLTAEIEPVPGMMRRILGAGRRGGVFTADAVDPLEVKDVEARLDLLATCRNLASEIAMNEAAPRVFTEVQSYLDPTVTTLIDGVRSTGEDERALRIVQIEAAIRFSARIFGQSYAQLLQKAADVAIAAARSAQK